MVSLKKNMQHQCPKSGVKIYETPTVSNTMQHPPYCRPLTDEEVLIDYHEKQLKYHAEQLKKHNSNNNILRNAQSQQSQLTMHQHVLPSPTSLVAISPSPQHVLPPSTTLAVSHHRPSQSPQQVQVYQHKDKTMDLDITNYSLEELLKLFDIENGNINDDTLKAAKKKMLKLHPDKSKISQEVYLFYQKAYQHLEKINTFKNKSIDRSRMSTKYSSVAHDLGEDNKLIAQEYFMKNSQFSNAKFNELFEKYYEPDEFEKTGYNDWLKDTTEDIVTPKVANIDELHTYFDAKRKEQAALIKYDGKIGGYYANDNNSLLLDKSAVTNYSGTAGSDIFNKGIGATNSTVAYTDIKQAFTESIIPVDMDIYNNRPTFKNINEYKIFRSNEEKNYNIPDKVASEAILEKISQEDDLAAAKAAYNLEKKQEKINNNMNNYWSNLKQLIYQKN